MFMLRVYVTFFFVPQDLIERINSYFQRIAFRRNLILIGFQHLRHKFFPMKISNLHWNGAVSTCNEKLWPKVAGEYQMS